MKEKTMIKVKMLGGFELACKERRVQGNANRSGRVSVFLAYLLLNREREISQTELIEAVWGGDRAGEVSFGALKTLCYRVREFLSELEATDPLILTNGNSYRWNPDIETELDVNVFRSLCRRADFSKDPEEKKELYERAAGIYTGELLPGMTDCFWLIPINTYYHTVYMKAIHALLPIYRERGEEEAIVALCSRALAFDPLDEDVHVAMIGACCRAGSFSRAYEQYVYAKKMYEMAGDIEFPQRLEELYDKIPGKRLFM